MVIIKINEQTQAGKVLLELARLFSHKEEGVRIFNAEEDTAVEDEHDGTEKVLDEGIRYLITKSEAYSFLEKEEELYTDDDLIERYDEKR